MRIYRFIEIDLDRPPASEGAFESTLYRFLPVDHAPIGLSGIPCLTDIREDSPGIDPKKPLGKRAKFSATMADFDDEGSRYFGKLLARHRTSYLHRPARVIEYRDGVEYRRSNFVVTSISGPSKGFVTLEAKDPLVMAIDKKLPEPTDNKLFGNIDAATNREIPISIITAPPASGIIRINEELIRYEHIRTDGGVFYVCACERGLYGTEPALHGVDDAVQSCIEYDNQHPLDIARDLLDRAGIDQYDDVSFDFYRDFWLAGSASGNVLSDPEDITKILGELLADVAAFLLWDGTKIQASAITPQALNETPLLLTDEDHIIADSMVVTDNISALLTRSAIAFGRRNYTDTGKAASKFRFIEIFADSDAEAEAGLAAGEVLYSHWLQSAGDAFTAVSRRVLRYNYGERKIQFSVDLKDDEVTPGEVRRISSDDFLDENGDRQLFDVLITEAEQNNGKHDISAVLLYETANVNFAFYAPDDAPDDYDTATESERLIMAFYADETGEPEYRYL